MRNLMRTAAVVLAMALVAGGCKLTESDQYRADVDFYAGVPIGITATIFYQPSFQIFWARHAFCTHNGADDDLDNPTATRCIRDLLLGAVTINGWGAAEWHDALAYHLSDFQYWLDFIELSYNYGIFGANGSPDHYRMCLQIHKRYDGALNWHGIRLETARCEYGKQFDLS